MVDEAKPCPLQPIDTAIDSLQQFKDYLDTACLNCQGKAQEWVDNYIEQEVNPYINQKLQEWRQTLLASLQDMYSKYSECIEPATSISNFSISADITKIVEFLGLLKDFVTKAYSSLMDFLGLFPSHLARLTTAVTSIVTYVPPISGVSFSKLNIQCEPITMDDITGGA